MGKKFSRSAEKNILYLDDEHENLESFRLVFMEHYNIFTATNAKAALDILDKESIQVVITDQRMPEISGLEFLRKIKTLYPEKITMIVSGYSDAEIVIKALNETGIYQFIAKPWSLDAFKLAIDNALEKHHLREDNKKLITDLKNSNTKLAGKILQLEDYLYHASHDIKGSLSRFLGLCIVGTMEFDAQARNYFNMLKQEAKNMEYLLQNHLALHYIDTIPTQESVVNFQQLTKNAKAKAFETLQSKEVEINIEIDLPSNLEVQADAQLLEVILYHLILNASIFNDTPPKVDIEFHYKESSQQFCFSIQDNGTGIDPSIFRFIFNKFYRGSNQSIGSGLGLFLVKLAVEKLQGAIKINSGKNEGTKVEVCIPL